MKKGLTALFIIGIIILCVFVAFLEPNSKITRIAIRTSDGSLYFWVGDQNVKWAIENGRPVVQLWPRVVTLWDEYYLAPSEMKQSVDIFVGNFDVISHEEGDFQGYAVKKDQDVFTVENTVVPSDKLGMKETISKIIIARPETNQTYDVESHLEDKWIMVPSTSSTGRGTALSPSSERLINIKEMAKELGYDISLEYDSSNKVLFVEYHN